MSILDTVPWLRPAKHSPEGVIRRLRTEVASLRDFKAEADAFKAGADVHFARLVADRDDVYRCWQKAAADRDTAEQLAACLAEDNALLWRRLAPFEAAEANRNAVDIPPGVRDVDPDDQPTHPTGIHVKTLRDALGIGPVHAVTNPGQTTPGAREEAA
jgi:hypothetical protein